ncbi:MAG: hypothetical protein ABI353_08120 [Isosphaeraceae bacterium]
MSGPMILLIPPTIDEIANRIERAVLRRRPEWRSVASLDRLWAVAADHLSAMHREDPALPLDPELYVAALPLDAPRCDPWNELVSGASVSHYRRRIKRIVRALRRELLDEVRRAEARLRRGEPAEKVLLVRCRSLSPLGIYIVAQRVGRRDLADRLRPLAREQHRACPLYRAACVGLISDEDYPELELVPGLKLRRRALHVAPPFSLN